MTLPAAQACASLSHLARQSGNAGEVVAHAEAGLEYMSTGPRSAVLEARLLAMRACGLAAGGRPVEATTTILHAGQVFERECAESSDLLSPFDSASLAIETAWCLLWVGDVIGAAGQLRYALAARPPDRIRSRALAELMLATALLGQGRPEEAATFALGAVERTTHLGSAVLVDRLRHVSLLFRTQVNSSPELAAVAQRLDDAVPGRGWITAAGPPFEPPGPIA